MGTAGLSASGLALAAMLDAGFDGTFALEGVRVGDQYERDGASLAYIRQVAEELS